MTSALHALPDGRHVAVGETASPGQLDRAAADPGRFEQSVVLEPRVLGDHHARVEQELREARTLNAALRDEIDVLKGQLAELAPYAEAGKRVAREAAESEYRNGSCDDCSCCTTAQCAERRCPTDSLGDSICPCTCY
jgi:hypothetical protein